MAEIDINQGLSVKQKWNNPLLVFWATLMKDI